MTKKQTSFCLMILVLFASLSQVFAQQGRIISGTIKDDKGSAVSGATVNVKGSSTSVISDEDGRYSITVADRNAILVISSVGLATKEIKVGDGNSLDVTLSDSGAEMTEVVVTALGIKKEQKAIGYSVQKISGDNITKVAPPGVAQGLMGKVAGLNISNANGVEGNSTRIVIRGNNSILGNNQPLIVIDGVQVQENPMDYDGIKGSSIDLGGTQRDWGSYLNFLNPDDIEEINVLKGPTAAALYGARGANGVVLITSKKGSKRKGLGIDYNLSSRWNDPYRYQELQNEYGYGGAIALWSATPSFPKDANGNDRYPAEAPWTGSGITDEKYLSQGSVPGGMSTWSQFSWYGTAASWGPKLDGREIIWWDGVKRPWSPNPDNVKSYFNTGNTTTHNVSFSGGGDNGTLRVSLSRTDNKAVVPNSHFNQTAVNVGSNIRMSRILNTEVTGSYTKYNRHNTPNIGDNNSWTKFMTYGMSRDYINLEKDIYMNPDGSKNKLDGSVYPLSYPYGGYGKDIYWNTYENNTDLKRDQLLGSVKLNADVLPWLNLMGRVSADYSTNEFESKNKPESVEGLDGKYGLEMNKNFTITSEAIGTIHKDNIVEDLNLNLSLGVSSWQNRFHGVKSENKGPFLIPFQYFLNNTSATLNRDWLPIEYRSESKINSAYGILDLSYRNYLFLQVTGRNDWSSTLPTTSNSFFYPSASLSFAFTDAFDMGAVSNWLDFGKVRVAYAQSANGTDPYQLNFVYSANVFGGVGTRTLPTTLPPLFLEPQRSNSYEIGTQLAFLKNRLNVDFTWYKINSTKQILDAPIPISSGADRVRFNTGELQNKGFEFIVRGRVVSNKNFGWDITVNGAHNQNKVVALDEGVDAYPLDNVFGLAYGAGMQVGVGDNYGNIYGYDYKYLNGQRVVQKLLGNNGETIGTRYVTTDAPVVIGNATPKLTGGIGNVFKYGNFSLYALVDFKWGGDIFSFDYSAAMGNGLAPETLKERNGGGLSYTYPDGSTANHGVILEGVFDDGTTSGKPNTDVVHYMYKYAGVYAAWSDIHMPRSAAVFENSWMKLRELSLSYEVPQSFVTRTKVFQGLNVSLIGRDLFYLFTTLPDKLNPEAISGARNAQGLQWAGYPGIRSFGVSVRARF